MNNGIENILFNINKYEPRGWDVIRTQEEGIFIITNGKFFGAKAYVLEGPAVDLSGGDL